MLSFFPHRLIHFHPFCLKCVLQILLIYLHCQPIFRLWTQRLSLGIFLKIHSHRRNWKKRGKTHGWFCGSFWDREVNHSQPCYSSSETQWADQREPLRGSLLALCCHLVAINGAAPAGKKLYPTIMWHLLCSTFCARQSINNPLHFYIPLPTLRNFHVDIFNSFLEQPSEVHSKQVKLSAFYRWGNWDSACRRSRAEFTWDWNPGALATTRKTLTPWFFSG